MAYTDDTCQTGFTPQQAARVRCYVTNTLKFLVDGLDTTPTSTPLDTPLASPVSAPKATPKAVSSASTISFVSALVASCALLLI